MSGALSYVADYVLSAFRERVTGEDFEGERIFRVTLIGSPTDAMRAKLARMFPHAQVTPPEVGRAPVVAIPMTGGGTGPRLAALLGRARHKLLVPSPDYTYRFGLRRGAAALVWAAVDRLLLWPVALARLGGSALWMYLTGLAQAAGRAQTRAGENPRRVVAVRLTPTGTFVGVLKRLREGGGQAHVTAVLGSPEGEAEVRAAADEVVYASGRELARAAQRLRRLESDLVVVAGGADYGLSPSYVKAALLARLSRARRCVQWEPGEALPGRPRGTGVRSAVSRKARALWNGSGGRLTAGAARRAAQRYYRQAPTRGPRLVQIGLSEACNYRCVMCPFHNPAADEGHRESEQPRMSFATFARLAGDLRRLGTRELDICGTGEPLTNPEAMEMIALAREWGFTVRLATNAGLLTSTRARQLVDLGIERMHVSLNAGSEAVYAQMHPGTAPGTLARIIARLREMAEYAEETGQRPVVVEFSAVLTRLNRHEIVEMVEAARAARAAQFMLIRMGPVKGQNDLMPQPEDWEEIREGVAKAKELAERYGMVTNLEEWQITASPEGTRSVYADVPCYIGSEFALVLASGTVKFCCHCFPPVGELSEGGFATLWRSEAYQRRREEAMAIPVTGRVPEHCGCFHSCSHLLENLAVHARLHGGAGRRGG